MTGACSASAGITGSHVALLLVSAGHVLGGKYLERTAAVASALLLAPTYVSGLADWSPSAERAASPLTPGLVRFLRDAVPARDVVFSDLESSYRIAAAAPVYICNAPPGHVADTKRNRPYVRRAQWRQFKDLLLQIFHHYIIRYHF